LRPFLHRVLVEPSLELHSVSNISGNGPPGQQTRMLKDDGAIDPRTIDALSINGNVSFVVRKQTRDNIEHRRLAATAGSDNRHKLSIFDGERNIRQCENVAILPLEPVMLRKVVDL